MIRYVFRVATVKGNRCKEVNTERAYVGRLKTHWGWIFLIWFYYGNMTAGLYANTVYTGNSSKFNEVANTNKVHLFFFTNDILLLRLRWRSFSFYPHLNMECYELSAVNWMGGGARNGVTGGRVCPWVEKQIYTSLIMIFIVQTIDVVHMLVLIAEVFLQLR